MILFSFDAIDILVQHSESDRVAALRDHVLLKPSQIVKTTGIEYTKGNTSLGVKS